MKTTELPGTGSTRREDGCGSQSGMARFVSFLLAFRMSDEINYGRVESMKSFLYPFSPDMITNDVLCGSWWYGGKQQETRVLTLSRDLRNSFRDSSWIFFGFLIGRLAEGPDVIAWWIKHEAVKVFSCKPWICQPKSCRTCVGITKQLPPFIEFLQLPASRQTLVHKLFIQFKSWFTLSDAWFSSATRFCSATLFH